MSKERGFAHFLPILVIAVVAVLSLLYITSKTELSKYVPESLRSIVSSSSIAPKADYQNPLDKESQYTNPFSENKNPFDGLE